MDCGDFLNLLNPLPAWSIIDDIAEYDSAGEHKSSVCV